MPTWCAVRQIARLGVGYTPGDRRIFPDLTVEQNLPPGTGLSSVVLPAPSAGSPRGPGKGRGQASVACPTSSTRTQRRSWLDSRIASTTCPMRWPNAKSGSAGRPAASAQSRSCTSIAFWSL